MSRIECQQCEGRGHITRMVPKPLGHCSNGEMVYSSRQIPENRFCDACMGRGLVEGEAASAAAPAPVTEPVAVVFADHQVDAPGFDRHSFERAMARALVDQLEIHRDTSGLYVVAHHGQNGGYPCSRHRCECPAGVHGQPCKHRAALIFHLDVREPALRRQWAAARKVVAA